MITLQPITSKGKCPQICTYEVLISFSNPNQRSTGLSATLIIKQAETAILSLPKVLRIQRNNALKNFNLTGGGRSVAESFALANPDEKILSSKP